MSDGTEPRTVVHRPTSQVYHIANGEGLPSCNTQNEATNPTDPELWETCPESEAHGRKLCSKCESAWPDGYARRERIRWIREHLPPVENPPIDRFTKSELAVIEDKIAPADTEAIYDA